MIADIYPASTAAVAKCYRQRSLTGPPFLADDGNDFHGSPRIMTTLYVFMQSYPSDLITACRHSYIWTLPHGHMRPLTP